MIGALQTILSRPKTVLMLMVVMVIAGTFSYISIPKEAQPDIDVPVYFVSVNQNGIAPGDAERLLVRPLETTLRGIDGLKELTAIAGEGYAAIVLEFTIDTDKDKVLADIRDKVDQAKAELPTDADEPVINETNFALQPTLIVTLSGKVPERTLYARARTLKDELEAISSVREANLSGNRDEILEVILDLTKLESYDITQTELLNALSQNNQLVPAGFIDDGQGRFNVKVPGLVESARDVYSIPIKQNGEGVVTLGDVAEIRRTFKDPSNFTRVNGEPAIAIEVVKRIGTNIIENNKSVREVVAKFAKDWPDTIKINFLLDQSNFINEVQNSLQASIMTAIALVMIVVVAALGLRSGLLVGISIPVSFMVGFLILASVGMTVNMMVMFGMVLTVGMLVDGAIVVTEYADRKISEGMPPTQAYERAASLMFWPVVSSTATTLAAFLPLLLWPGVPGEFMSYLPIMVIIVLSASLMTALVFLPTAGAQVGRLTAWFGKHAAIFLSLIAGAGLAALAFALLSIPAIIAEVGFGVNDVVDQANKLAEQQGITTLAERMIMIVAAIAGVVFAIFIYPVIAGLVRWQRSRPIKEDEVAKMLSSSSKLDIRKVPGITGVYLWILKKLTGNLVGNAVVIALVLGTTFSVFALFGSNNAGVEFFVDEEPDVAIVLVSGRGNMAATEIRDLVHEVSNRVSTVKGIRNIVSTSRAPGGGGGGGGNVIGGVQDKPADVIGELQIELGDYCCRRKAVDIFAEIREKTGNMPGIRVEVRKIEGGPPTGKDLRLEVKSSNYDQMVAAIARVRAHVDTMTGLQDREDSRPLPGIEWELTVNREEAGRYNAGIVAIGSMVQLVTNGVMIGKYRPDDSDDEVEIRVRLPKEQRSFDFLDQLKLRTSNGQVPLSNFVERSAHQKVSSITRRDGLYAMDVKANLISGFKENGKAITPDDKVKELQTWLDTQKWPSSVQMKFRGADAEQRESGEFLMRAAAIALFLMFIILVTQFNSFYQAILTLSTVVLAIVGVLIGLIVTGQKFSIIMTGTGVVALAGIVVNNAIVLIDTYNRMRKEGVEVREAVLKTSAQRLRPIMLTTVTTILGLVPMALTINLDFIDQRIMYGGITAIWWIQLSTAVIFGLAYSTLLTLVMIPMMLALPANIASSASLIGRILFFVITLPWQIVKLFLPKRSVAPVPAMAGVGVANVSVDAEVDAPAPAVVNAIPKASEVNWKPSPRSKPEAKEAPSVAAQPPEEAEAPRKDAEPKPQKGDFVRQSAPLKSGATGNVVPMGKAKSDRDRQTVEPDSFPEAAE
ncbi:MAG: efflux RND transporter permease subunit [Pseudomonadota bacterium]